MSGDLAKLSPQEPLSPEQVSSLLQMDINLLNLEQRSRYLWFMAERFGLDPMSKPFDAIPGQNGKLILYANRTAAEQLRKVNEINLEIVERGFLVIGNETADVYVVRSRATLPNGRSDEALGAVPLRKGMDAESMANAIMKAETKAKRRVTLSICGLGLPDETELETIPTKGKGAEEPKRIFPERVQTYPAAGATNQTFQAQGQAPQLQTVEVAGEAVNPETGEVVGLIPGGYPAPPQAAPPNLNAPQPIAPKQRFPPAVAPASVKKA